MERSGVVRDDNPRKKGRRLPRCAHASGSRDKQEWTLGPQWHREKSKIGRIGMLGSDGERSR